MITNRLLSKVSKTIKEDCDLTNGVPIIVGVSGGADSLCLLDLLIRLGLQPVIAHFNHGIREEAQTEADFVNKIGSLKGLEVIQGAGSVPEHSNTYKLSIEESARILRYQFLFKQATILNAQAVAVGHNADDQVETILMHLLRGTGLNGLTGMSFLQVPNQWSQHIPMVRPLLNIWRKEIDTYCLENNLEPVFDRTNLDTGYLRNYIRHDVIPLLVDIAPGFKKRIWQTGDLLSADQAVLNNLTVQVLDSLVLEKRESFISVDLKTLKSNPIGLQRRLIRKIVGDLLGNIQDVDCQYTESVLNYIGSPGIGRGIDIGRGLRVMVEEDTLFFLEFGTELPTHDWPQVIEEKEIEVPGEVNLGFNWILHLETLNDLHYAHKLAKSNINPNQVWLDPGDKNSRLNIRTRRPGERFKPLGMDRGSMKLSDYMINKKIPFRARENWPLLCVGDEIAWVVGYQLSHSYRLSDDSRNVIRCELLSIR